MLVAALALAGAIVQPAGISDDSVAAADAEESWEDWEYTVRQSIYHTSKWAGGFSKDWAEYKTWWAGGDDAGKLSDTKKYGVIAALGITMAFLSFAFPDPTSKFHYEMQHALNALANRLGEMVWQVDGMYQQAMQILSALDDLELSVRGDLTNMLAASIITQYEGPGNYYFTRELDKIQLDLDLNDGESEYVRSEEFAANQLDYFSNMRTAVLDPYYAFRVMSQNLFALDAKVLADRLLDDGNESDEARLQYYRSMWATAAYYDAIANMAAMMLNEYSMYWAFAEPEAVEYHLGQATTVIDEYDDYRRGLYRTAGHPDGDTVWSISLIGEELGTVEVYFDNDLISTVEDTAMIVPDVDDDSAREIEITLTDDRAEVPATGWAMLAVDGGPDSQFLGWGTDFVGTGTMTVEAPTHDWSLISATFGKPWSQAGLQIAGVGEVEVWEEGESVMSITDDALGELENERLDMLVDNDPNEIVLTTDAATAEAAFMALLVDAGAEWDVDGTAVGSEHVIPIEPGERVEIEAIMAASTIDAELTGLGSLAVYRNGQPVDRLRESGPIQIGGEQVLLTSDVGAVPDIGWALVAEPWVGSTFMAWSGTHDGIDDVVIAIPFGERVDVSAHFEASYAVDAKRSTLKGVLEQDVDPDQQVYDVGVEHSEGVMMIGDEARVLDPIIVRSGFDEGALHTDLELTIDELDFDFAAGEIAHTEAQGSYRLTWYDQHGEFYRSREYHGFDVVATLDDDVIRMSITSGERPVAELEILAVPHIVRSEITATADGPGSVYVYRDGERQRFFRNDTYDFTIDDTELVLMSRADLDNGLSIPQNGWVLYASHDPAPHAWFKGWSGDHTGNEYTVLEIEPGSAINLTATTTDTDPDIVSDSIEVTATATGPGSLVVYRDGEQQHEVLNETTEFTIDGTELVLMSRADLDGGVSIPQSGWVLYANDDPALQTGFEGWSGDHTGNQYTVLEVEPGSMLDFTATTKHVVSKGELDPDETRVGDGIRAQDVNGELVAFPIEDYTGIESSEPGLTAGYDVDGDHYRVEIDALRLHFDRDGDRVDHSITGIVGTATAGAATAPGDPEVRALTLDDATFNTVSEVLTLSVVDDTGITSHLVVRFEDVLM